MRRPRDDAGSTHVLEAVIIATIMVSSVIYVATFQSPPAATTNTRAGLQQRSQDALDILADTPVPGSSFGDNMLSAYSAACLQGSCDDLRQTMERLLPPGTQFSLSISNGFNTWPVYEPRSPPGEAVTTSHLMEPKWSYTFLGTGQSLVNPSRDPLYTYSLPVFDSNVLDQGGSPLRVILHGSAGSGNFTLSTAATTEARKTTSAATPAASLFFVDGSGTPVGALDIAGTTAHGTPSTPTHANVQFRLRLQESANQPIPAGAQLDVSLPRGWNASVTSALDPGWTIVASAANATGGATDAVLSARLATALQNGTRDFVFNATYQGDLVGDYLFHAAMSRGSLAQAGLAVRADTSTTSSYATPVFTISAPRPMGASATTTWTLGATIPNGTAVTVNSIEIVEQDGRSIFGNASVVSGGGSVVAGGDRIVWTAPDVDVTSFLTLALNVTPSGTVASPDNPRAEFQPPMTVANFTGRWIESAGTGLWRQALLPNVTYGGYDTNSGLSLTTNHSMSSEGTYKGIAMPGSGNYTLGNVSTSNTAAYGSYVGLERRQVATGDTAVVDIDVQSLLFTLSSAGQKAGITLHVYPPWSGDQRIPIQSNTSFDTELLTSDVMSMTLLDVNGDGYADPVLGTSNGRVLALHALTGGRIEADVFSAPFDSSQQGSTAPSITQLGLIDLGGQTYIVVTTNQGSVFVLDHSLRLAWSWYWSSASPSNVAAQVISMDASADVDGDGRHDVVVGVQVQDQGGASAGNVVFVLRALVGDPYLEAWDPADGPSGQNQLYTTVGTPNAVLGLSRIGPAGTHPGIATTFQYTPGLAGVGTQSINPLGPSGATATLSLPKAGMHGVNNDSTDAWTFSGPPITVARTYDYEGNGIPDIVGGAPAGYVFMMNGTEPTSPVVSTSLTSPPATEVIASATHDGLRSAFLTRDRSIYYTTDGWISQHNVCDPATQVCLAPLGAAALAMNASSSFWVAGSAGGLWRTPPAADSASASSLNLATVSPINATKDGSAFDLGVTGTLYNFNGVSFRWGDQGNVGFVIGTPVSCVLAPCAAEDLVMNTSTGGQTWTVASNASGTLQGRDNRTVTAPLVRLNFSTDSLGWIVGGNGTLLRTLDGGAHWHGVNVSGTIVNLTDVSCAALAPDTCIVVGASGHAWRTTNSRAAYPTWTAIDLGPAASGRDISSVGLVNTSVAYAGASNLILKTWDGGDHWTVMPLSYVPSNGDIVNVLPDGQGYVYGGTATTQRTFYLGAHNLTSRAQTTNVATGLPPGSQVTRVDMEVSDSQNYATPPSTSMSIVTFNVTADGGAHWFAASTNSSGYVDPLTNLVTAYYPKASSHAEWGSQVYDYVEGWTTSTATATGSDVRVRMDFNTTGDFAAFTASVHAITLNVTYWNGSAYNMMPFTVDLNSTAKKDAANTDAVWVDGGGSVYQPLVQPYWVRNVSGSVQDLLVGLNVTGDSRAEVYVSTGAVIAENSPDSIPYAGNNPGMTIAPDDNRVYLLDGKNGTIAAQTASFGGAVTHLALSDSNGDGVPEYLYATVWDGASTAQLVCMDPATLAIKWQKTIGATMPTALAAGALQGANATAFVTDRTGGTPPVPGRAMAYRGWDGSSAWSAVPDQQGHYTVNIPVGKNWLFGPYVVEAAVDWNTTGYQVGNATPQALVQTERFYDYFLVTPPGALAPPSPVYNVQLTTWYEDWR